MNNNKFLPVEKAQGLRQSFIFAVTKTQLMRIMAVTITIMLGTYGSSLQAATLSATRSDASFRCGAVALENVLFALKGTNAVTKAIDEALAPATGFSMTVLSELSAKSGFDLVPVRQVEDGNLIVPSIVHWQRGHYSAIVGKRGDFYRVLDSLVGPEIWLDKNTIIAGSKGNFLVPQQFISPQWRRLTQVESDAIVGTGPTQGPPDPFAPPPCTSCPCNPGQGASQGGKGPMGQPRSDSNGSGSSGKGPLIQTTCSSCGGGSGPAGMPTWDVTEPYMDLWLMDTPLEYKPGVGTPISFNLNYKQREQMAALGTNGGIFSCGPMWDFSWLRYITYSKASPLDDPIQMFVSGGGIRDYELLSDDYTTNDTVFSEPEYYTSTALAVHTDDFGTPVGFTVYYPDGAVDNYNYSTEAETLYYFDYTAVKDVYGPTFFLSSKVDRAGHATQFIYGTDTNNTTRLLYVIDADGRTNALSYTNTSYPAQITGVTDPFGRSINLEYDTNGVLANITDVQNLSSSFMYTNTGAYYWVTNLTTPYGTNSFSFTDLGFPDVWDSSDDIINRSVMVVDPDGGTNLYVYRDYSTFMTNFTYDIPSSPSDIPVSIQSTYPFFRNSWHWGSLQFASLSTSDPNSFTPTDYLKGRQRHWFHINGTDLVSDTLNMEQSPSPDGVSLGMQTWYDYPGDSGYYNGTNAMPQLIAYNLPDGNSSFTWIQRDLFGHPTNVLETYSLGFGTASLQRSNIYVYSTNGIDLIQHIGPKGETLEGYSYDNNHDVLTMTNAVGDVTTYTYDSAFRLTSVHTPAGLTTTNIYYASGAFMTNWLLKTIDLEIQRTNSYGYFNDLTSVQTNELGLVTTYTWNNLQQLTSTSFPDDTYISNIYQNLDMVETIDRLGLSAKYQYDPLRHLVAATNALGNVTRYDYCACGALESMQDSLGNYTHYYYDIAGRLTNTTYPDGMFWIKHYNALGQVTNMVDEAEVSHTNWFNNQGLLYASSNAFGQVYDRSFDIEDRLTNQVDANGVSVSMTYDNLGRMLTRSYPDAGVERFGYSPAGLIAYTNQLTNRTYYAYDAARRKTAETNANNNMTFYGYDAASDLISLTDQKNSVTQWGYDLYGRVTNKVDATSTTILKYGYDADNRLTNRWSAEKGNTAYGYDNVGNLTGVTYPVSPALSFSYNAMNWMTGMSDGIGATTFTYTPAGQLASETGPWANDTVAYTYYDRLRTGLNLQQPSASAWVQSYDYDAANRLHSITSPAGTFDYHYSPGVDGTTASSGLVAQINLPNTAIITNTYDNNARMLSTSLKNSGGVDLDSYAYTYNVGNQRTAVNRTSENTANYTYDPIGQVISDTAAEGTTNRLNEQLHYGYDPSGNLAARTNNALVQDFSVNSLNELTSNTNSGTLTVVGTTTSQATNVTVNGTAAAHYGDATFAASGLGLTTTYTAVAQDSFGRTASNTVTVNLSPAVTFQYDANGNLTNDGLRSFAYDDENQLIQVWVNNRWMSQFQYDARLRRRIRQEYTWTGSSWNKTNEVHYVYDRRLLIQERDVNNLPIATYVRGEDLSKSFEGMGGIGGLLARTSQQFATDPLVGYSYYHCDGNGSVTMLINESQVVVAKYIYDAFGNLLSESGLLAHNNPFGFSSKEIDRHSGLVYYFYRYYDPNLQRWLNKDPISEQGGINLYEFALNSPEIIVDKNGKKPVFNDPTKGGFPGEGQPISDPGNKPTTDPTAPPQGNLGGPGSPGASGLAGLPGLLNPEHGDDDTAGWTPIQSAMQCWKQSGHTDPFAPPAVFGAGGTPPPTSSAGPMQPLPPLPSVPSFPPFQPPPPTLSQGGPSAPPGMGCSICPVNNPVSF